jgi:hypothetical protein
MRCPQSAFLRNLQKSNPALPQGFLLQEPQAKPAEAMALPITTASPDPAKNSLPISSPISFVAKRKSLNQLSRWLHDTTLPSAEATWLHFQTLLLCEQMSRSILHGFATRSAKEIRPASQRHDSAAGDSQSARRAVKDAVARPQQSFVGRPP